VENQSNVAMDSFTLELSFGGYRLDAAPAHILQFEQRHVPAIAPNQRIVFVDTAVIAPETRTTSLAFNRTVAYSSEVDLPPDIRIAGDSIVPVLSTGFELETVVVPNQELLLNAWGNWRLASKVRSNTDWGFVIRIHNPYDVALEPMHLSRCLIDLDYCPRTFTANLESLTPRVPPAEFRDYDVVFRVVSTDYTWFWNYMDAVVAVCYPLWLRGTCTYANIRLIPDMEAQCTIPTIQPGVQITDDTADCDHTGSAYRFLAHAGERYRVNGSVPGRAFIVDAEGKDLYEDGLTEMTIPKDGMYYVILNQVSHPTITFTLNRL
jgi:hypothetical protein